MCMDGAAAVKVSGGRFVGTKVNCSGAARRGQMSARGLFLNERKWAKQFLNHYTEWHSLMTNRSLVTHKLTK